MRFLFFIIALYGITAGTLLISSCNNYPDIQSGQIVEKEFKQPFADYNIPKKNPAQYYFRIRAEHKGKIWDNYIEVDHTTFGKYKEGDMYGVEK